MTKTKNDIAKTSGSTKDPKKKAAGASSGGKSQKDSKKGANKKPDALNKSLNAAKGTKGKPAQILQKTGKNNKATKNAKTKPEKNSGSNKSKAATKKDGSAKEKKAKKPDSDDETEAPTPPSQLEKTDSGGKADPAVAEPEEDSKLSPEPESSGGDKDKETKEAASNEAKDSSKIPAAPVGPAVGDEEKDKGGESNAEDDDKSAANDDKAQSAAHNEKNAEEGKKNKNEDAAKLQPEEDDDEEESTKPTINQLKKNTRKMRVLGQGDKIATKEFEQLNDELMDLHGSVQTLKHSYGSIMNSLVALQKRRPKRNRKNQQKFGLISTPSTANLEDMAKQQNDEIDPYDIGHFLNPLTRDETFKMLFNEIEKLQDATEKFRSSFNNHGHFLQPKFDVNCGKIVNRSVYNQWTTQTYRLQTIVDEIIRNYNDDLLNLFRL